MKPPAFQFYPDDFIGGTCDLSAEEVGAYIRLLCYQWSRGSIPDDAAKLARIAGVNVTPDTLQKFPDGKNARLEFERQKQAEFREERAKSGKMGAVKRWQNHSSAIAVPSHSDSTAIVLPMANTMANDSSPSPSPSPSPFLIPDSRFPEPAPAPQARKVTKEKTADPRHQPFIKAFCDAYLTGIGQKFDMSDKKHGSQMARFLKAHPDIELEEWQSAIDWCYQVRHDPFAKAPVHNISNLAAFCTGWPQLVAYHQIYQLKK